MILPKAHMIDWQGIMLFHSAITAVSAACVYSGPWGLGFEGLLQKAGLILGLPMGLDKPHH